MLLYTSSRSRINSFYYHTDSRILVILLLYVKPRCLKCMILKTVQASKFHSRVDKFWKQSNAWVICYGNITNINCEIFR